jgi:DNA polymerase-3 subunit delta'
MATLGSIYGQDAAVSALRKGLEADQLAGAYLFVGQAGVGKVALARAFAQAACCLAPKLALFDACGVCDSCRRAEQNAQPEIVTIAPAGEQMQIWQFWDRDNRPPGILTHTLSYAPSIGRRRVYLIDNADVLTESAANSLLKSLEEPPPYALFVLLASHAARVLPTIVSRCQLIRLRVLAVDELAAFLREQVGVEPERAAMLAAYSEGRIGQAVQLARNPLVAEEIGRVLELAEMLPDAPRVRALRVAEQMRKLATQIKAILGEEPAPEAAEDEAAGSPKERAGRRQLAAVFDLLVAFYRDLFALSVQGTGARIINRDRAARRNAGWPALTRSFRPAVVSTPTRMSRS